MERALLEADDASAAVHLRGALLVDPWFCQWLAAWPAADGDTIDGLAQWLSSGLVEKLATLGDDPPGWTRPSDSEAVTYAQQAAAMLNAATESVGVLEPGSSPAFLSTIRGPVESPTDVVVANEYLTSSPSIEWRLPRIVQRLASSVPFGEFDSRLERAKLDAMKELAYGASHEVNNPLANISGRAQALLREEEDPKKQRLLAAIDAQALRAHEMISDLMLFARPPALDKRPTDLGKLAAEVVDELRTMAEQRDIVLEVTDCDTAPTTTVDATQVAVAVKALVQNGIDAVGNDGRVTVGVCCDSQHVVVRVGDTGPGIADDVRLHMFDPFYSGREAGRGLGFGLSKCWRIATDHGGSVEVEATGVTGTTIALRLPLSGGEQ